MRAFFNNASYATWAQSFIVLLSVMIAIIALRATDKGQAVQASFSFGQKFYLDNPSPSNASLLLRANQFKLVQVAKTQIPDYDEGTDLGHARLFQQVAPSLRESVLKEELLQQYFAQVDGFFSSLLVCLNQQVCDKEVALKMLGREVLDFFNAVCPFIEEEDRLHRNSNIRRYMSFLVDVAGYKDSNDHVCKVSLASYTTKAPQKVQHVRAD
jgi:hypothetical protein